MQRRPMSTHRRAVEQIRESYAAIPEDAAPRLAKATSNLFRFRDAGKTAKLSARDLDQVISVDPVTMTAEVQGMTTYEHLVDATLPHGLMPLRRAAAQDDHAGRRGDGARHRVDAASGTGCRTSRSRSWRSSPATAGSSWPATTTSTATCSAPSPTPTARSATRCGSGSSSGPVQPYVRLTPHPLHRRRQVHARHAGDLRERRARRGAGRLRRRHVLRPRRAVPHRRRASPSGPVRRPTTPACASTTSRSRQRDRDWLTVRDYLWRWDTDWFWCSRAFGVQQPLVRSLMPRRWMRSDVYRSWSRSTSRYGVIARVDRWRGQPLQESVIQDVEVPGRAGRRVPGVLPRQGRHERRSGCARCGPPATWPLYPLEPGELYVNFGFWGMVAAAPGQFDGYYNRLIEHAGRTSSTGTSRSTPRRSTPGRSSGGSTTATAYWPVKRAYDPGGRLLDLYDKCVRGR